MPRALARLGKTLGTQDRRPLLGWMAVLLSTSVASLWAFWGAVENFHEGWYYPTLAENLLMALVQYVGLALLFVGLGALAIRWPRVGGTLYLAAAVFAVRFFSPQSLLSPAAILMGGPLTLIGLLFFFGQPQPRKWAYVTAVGVPLLVMIASAAEPAYRVAGRVDDGYRGARLVEGDGVRLIWAPAGPGWPEEGTSWHEARRVCSYLAADGTSLADTPQNIWRLPTVDEAVRSMARHGENAGGAWDAVDMKATYRVTPDKESPLWNTRSLVIYWWTATELDDSKALIVAYDGGVWPRTKTLRPGYLAFRAVKDAPAPGLPR